MYCGGLPNDDKNVVNDPKVIYELREGGAPKEDLGRMEMLVSEYEDSGAMLSWLVLNGGMFDIKPRVAEKIVALETDEAAVQAIIDNKEINRPGGLFKIGIIVANCGVSMEAANIIEATGKLENIEKVQNQKENAAKDPDDAVFHLGIWVGASMKDDTNTVNPKLGKQASVAILKVLLPGIDPGAKGMDYKIMGACVKWLGGLAGGTTWIDEMKSYEAKMQETDSVTTRLF